MANGFTKTSVRTLTLGEKLRKIREDRRISLNEISRVTKIQVKYLEFLEQGDYDQLPVDVYVKGFLRSYANFLGVDEKNLLRLYKKEKGIKNNLEGSKKKKIIKKNKPVSISSFVFTPKKIIISITSVLVLVGLLFIYREIESYANAPRLVVLNPDNNSEIYGNSTFVNGITDKDVLIFINSQPVLVDDEGKFSEKINLQSGTSIINIKAINKFQKEVSKEITVQSNYNGAENINNGNAPEKQPSGAAGAEYDKLQMEIRVDPGPVWLAVEVDGDLIFSETVLSDVVQKFEANDKITVSSGKGNSTFIKFNGKDIGALNNEPGAVKDVIFDRSGKY